MKKLYSLSAFLLLIITLQSCIVSQKPKMDFFDHSNYDNKDVKFISVNVPMFLAKPIVKRALREDGESEELINLIKKVSDIKVMTVENGNENMVSDYAKYLTKNNYEEWMTIKKDKEIIKFQAKQKGEEIRRLLITIASEKDLVYVDVSGKFTADDISRIINYSEKNDIKKLVSK
ncbi:DUF4252 domain-containing protein [Kaistella jeonii]|uniref:DUF4252 domain-containing protein n=1 Tax=Kaistella jeonii TaxID=266749 RepID=A0A0C1CZ51_9FLAO|nr:DUF4252 domain-containing protein [Kaistella jeonii]KIA89706.1 hypothetical protein OA86_03515 [Kaistella jeonii]SFB87996.1 protein of unknown function [Kaistella jeonii]VEI95930.1 Uncharacterised protein [Kaistella jeonii]